MAEISIMVPVYNVEKYLEACLDSILAQTFTDLEIICMDDGSTDRSGIILDRYAMQDERVRVVHKENTGYGKTMNMAMQLARGTYVGIVESDDTIDKDMYRTMYDIAEAYKLDCVKTDFYAVWGRGDGTVKKQYCRLTDDSGMYCRILRPNLEKRSYLLEKFTWNALYKREWLIKNHIRYNETPGASYQDNGFWFQTFYWADRVFFLNQAFYNYRQDNMASSIHDRRKVYAMKDEFDFIREFMMKQNTTDRELYDICFHLRMMEYISTLHRIDLPLKREFAETITAERHFYEKQGEACYDYMTEEQRFIIAHPSIYVEKELIGFTEITSEVLSGYNNIIVYGAGAYGERIVCRVQTEKAKTQTLYVAVTKLRDKHMACQGEAVHEITEYAMDKDNTLVILAVKEDSDHFAEMLAYVRKLHFTNIISASAKRLDTDM